MLANHPDLINEITNKIFEGIDRPIKIIKINNSSVIESEIVYDTPDYKHIFSTYLKDNFFSDQGLLNRILAELTQFGSRLSHRFAASLYKKNPHEIVSVIKNLAIYSSLCPHTSQLLIDFYGSKGFPINLTDHYHDTALNKLLVKDQKEDTIAFLVKNGATLFSLSFQQKEMLKSKFKDVFSEAKKNTQTFLERSCYLQRS